MDGCHSGEINYRREWGQIHMKKKSVYHGCSVEGLTVILQHVHYLCTYLPVSKCSEGNLG